MTALTVIRFWQGGLGWAIEARHVRGTIGLGFVTAVPTAPAVIAGVFTLRGSIVTVIDLAALDGQPPTQARQGQPALLVEVEGNLVAIRADLVADAAVADLDGAAVRIGADRLELVDPATMMHRVIAAAHRTRGPGAAP